MLTLAAPAARAATTGTVSGQVTNSVGTPLEGALVEIVDAAGGDDYYDEAETDGTGHFTFSGLPAGGYKIYVEGTGPNVGTYYPSTTSFASAGTITVTGGATTTANVTMVKASGITGKATKAAGGVAAGATVEVLMPYAGSWYGVDEDETDVNGNYSFSRLPAGSYAIAVYLDGYQPEYYDGVHTLSAATPVVVAVGETKNNINFQLDVGGAISGTVKDRNGTPARGLGIRVSNEDGTVGYGQTNANGNYTVNGLPTGTYKVSTSDTDRYSRASVNATVTVPNTTANVNLVVTQLSVVTGTVRDHTGAKVPYGDLTIFQKVGTRFEYSDAYGEVDDGVYSVALPPGTYRIQATGYSEDEDYVDSPTFYGNVPSLDAATDIKVNSYEDTIGGKNIQLLQGATVAGTIDVPAGVDVDEDEGIRVDAVNASTGKVVAGTYSDGDYYEIGGLPAGSYKVQFAREGAISPLAGQYYNGVSESAGLAAATTVTLAKGQVRTNVNATMTQGAVLTGKVLHADGGAAPGCLVQVYTTDDHLTSRYAFTKADGTFSVEGLSSGDFDVAVHADAYNGDTEEEAIDNAWKCAGVANPGDGSVPDSGYYSDVSGTLSNTQKNLRTVAVGASGSTAMPVDLRFGTPAGTVQNLTVPTITGAPIVGNELIANPGTWDPADVDLSYVWRVGPYAVGGNEPTFTPSPSMAGLKVTVRVTASAEGLASKSVTSAATEPIADQAFVELENVTLPKITGTAKVGQVLTAGNGTWTPSGPDLAYTYQWLRNGSPISGATKQKYTAGAGDLGAQLRVKVTASKPGALNRSKTTAPTALVKAGTLAVKGGSVSGKTKVGKKLRATPPSCTPGAKVSYRWLRNGSPISGATKSAYKVKKADKGKKISVRITLARAGYTTVVKTIKAGKVK